MLLYEENKENYALIIANIKKYRKKRGLTQQGLALRAHISKGYLSQIEAKNYKHFCSLDVLMNIADALEIPLFKLFLPPNVVFIDEQVAAELDYGKIRRLLDQDMEPDEEQ
ncbi:helix-turn-helix transcriptional regulator [Oscillospiraceae bacterium NSJ-54]|uniref:Helix-turn-helix transcriptional regulator n=2 Tax=Zongyangia hominis TaxID=2763677 RepID=A0A926EBB7_9FIRM|nr:helix-turn-helix transcriptional regulator [Zongyangia hominis]